ncbi:MAG: hypothetical protein IJH32_10095 [Ruminococcus sp.]|nr:hypothetical protein [Ruminococcus sp.]
MKIYIFLEYMRCALYGVTGFMMILVGCGLYSYLKALTDKIRKENTDGNSKTDP